MTKKHCDICDTPIEKRVASIRVYEGHHLDSPAYWGTNFELCEKHYQQIKNILEQQS